MSELNWKRVGPMSEEAVAPGGWKFSLKVEAGVVFASIHDAANDFVARIVDGVSGVEAHRWALQQIASWAESKDKGAGEITPKSEVQAVTQDTHMLGMIASGLCHQSSIVDMCRMSNGGSGTDEGDADWARKAKEEADAIAAAADLIANSVSALRKKDSITLLSFYRQARVATLWEAADSALAASRQYQYNKDHRTPREVLEDFANKLRGDAMNAAHNPAMLPDQIQPKQG